MRRMKPPGRDSFLDSVLVIPDITRHTSLIKQMFILLMALKEFCSNQTLTQGDLMADRAIV